MIAASKKKTVTVQLRNDEGAHACEFEAEAVPGTGGALAVLWIVGRPGTINGRPIWRHASILLVHSGECLAGGLRSREIATRLAQVAWHSLNDASRARWSEPIGTAWDAEAPGRTWGDVRAYLIEHLPREWKHHFHYATIEPGVRVGSGKPKSSYQADDFTPRKPRAEKAQPLVRVRVVIGSKQEWRHVPGELVDEAGMLAVHKTDAVIAGEKGYTLTHIGTGAAVVSNVRTAEKARRVGQWLDANVIDRAAFQEIPARVSDRHRHGVIEAISPDCIRGLREVIHHHAITYPKKK